MVSQDHHRHSWWTSNHHIGGKKFWNRGCGGASESCLCCLFKVFPGNLINTKIIQCIIYSHLPQSISKSIQMFTLSNSSSSTKILQRKLVFRIHDPKGTCQKNSQRLRLTQDPWTKSWVHLTVNRRNLENILYQNILTAWSPFFIISDLLWSIFNRMWQQTCSWHKVLWLKSWSTQPEHKYQF